MKKVENPPSKRILYISNSASSFVRQDIDELSKEYRVTFKRYDLSQKALTPLFMARNFFHVLFNAKKFDTIVVSFGSYLAYVTVMASRIRRRKAFIILHGTDCAAIHCIHYGSLRGKLLRSLLGKAYQKAHLLPVSTSLIATENKWIPDPTEQRQGLSAFFEADRFEVTAIPNGFNIDFWTTEGQKEAKSFLSVFGAGQFTLKGGDLMVEMARQRPDITIRVIGITKAETGLCEVPENIHFLGRMPQPELKELYQQSQFYLQLSMYEGFGCSLCEAMLCEMIPITSSSNMLPEIVKTSGISVQERDVTALLDAVDTLTNLSNEALTERAKEARNHVATHYPIAHRINEMKRVFEGNQQ